MPDFASLCDDLRKRRAEGETYESIASDYPPQITRAHIWKMIAKGWEPSGAKLRQALKLPATVAVIPINGAVIPPRTQVHHADECVRCGRAFVSNHPRRKKCFICSPFRGKRAEYDPSG